MPRAEGCARQSRSGQARRRGWFHEAISNPELGQRGGHPHPVWAVMVDRAKWRQSRSGGPGPAQGKGLEQGVEAQGSATCCMLSPARVRKSAGSGSRGKTISPPPHPHQGRSHDRRHRGRGSLDSRDQNPVSSSEGAAGELRDGCMEETTTAGSACLRTCAEPGKGAEKKKRCLTLG